MGLLDEIAGTAKITCKHCQKIIDNGRIIKGKAICDECRSALAKG